MPERVVPNRPEEAPQIREAVSVSTRKIFDGCRDKDCVDDLRVYPTLRSQAYIENALSIRPRSAELLHVAVKVEPISFNRGHYTVDCTYFYRVAAETFPAGETAVGLAIFDKRVMLFGSEGNSMTFSSVSGRPRGRDGDLPVAVVNAVDPIALHMKLVDAGAQAAGELEPGEIPAFIRESFPEELVLGPNGRRWYATIGQFSLIRLERDTQLLIPAYDYSLPEKECAGSSEDDTCELFGRIRFPVEEFFPPDSVSDAAEYRNMV